ncbi:hypothetical protein ABPG75_006306 [Micractinium tetrahymenae]
MSATQRSVWGPAPAAACCPPAGVAASAVARRPQPAQRGPVIGGSGLAPAAVRGALLVAGAATGLVAPGYQSEWELYQAENDFATRAIGVSSIIRQLARTFRQEWETYRAEWQAQARLVEPKPQAADAVAQPLAESLDPDYCPGGYHLVTVGEKFSDGRYTALHPLGQGHYSTVWMAHDAMTGQQVAMKIVRSAESYTAAARREVSMLAPIRDNDPSGTASHCVRLLDSFDHVGPNGRHVVEVFEAMGDDLLALIKAYDFRGVPLHIVRHLVRQTLVALDYLHTKCNIIHTDIKPENVVLTETLQPRGQEQEQIDMAALEPRLQRIGCKIVDFGNACWTHHHFSEDIQTRPYRSPEVILGASYSDSADMWSLACMVFELVTGDYLFHPLGDGERDKDVQQLAQMMARLGDPPAHIARTGTYAVEFFTPEGKLLQPLHPNQRVSLDRVLVERYGLSAEDAVELADFLLPMLDYDPSRRASAARMLHHPWLAGDAATATLLNNISPAQGVVERSLRVKWGSPRQVAPQTPLQ